MQKQIEKRIQTFVEGLGGITRSEMMNGTLYIKLDQESDCDFIHTELRDYYREYINPEGGVNMHYVGDEFAFDFVPADAEKKPDPEDESPAFPSYEENGIWSEFAEEEQYRNMPDEVDMMLNLQEEMKRGK